MLKAHIYVLLLLIVLFYFFPKSNVPLTGEEYSDVSAFQVIEIPVTRQQQSRKKISKPVIPVEGFEEEPVLEDVNIAEESSQQEDDVDAPPVNSGGTLILPRQIFEVVPDQMGDCSGEITLNLLIDEEGRVKEYTVLESSIADKTCVEKIVRSIKNSRWKAATRRGVPLEFWIEKRYSFN